jgi:hypothetical protein
MDGSMLCVPEFIKLKSSRLLFLLLFLICIPVAFAQGGPPLVTDDPGTPGNKHWEINIAYTQSKFDYGTVFELPHLDLNYGYGDNVQLKLEGPLTIFNGNGNEELTGLGFTEWGVKWRFQNDSKTRPAISTYPQIFFVGNQRFAQLGVIDPGTDFFLPVEVMKSFGLFTVDVEGGVMFRQFAQNQYWSGICGEYDLSKKLALLGELHRVSTASFAEDQFIWNLGFKLDFTENESIIFSAGRSLVSPTDDDPGFLLYAGIQVRT